MRTHANGLGNTMISGGRWWRWLLDKHAIQHEYYTDICAACLVTLSLCSHKQYIHLQNFEAVNVGGTSEYPKYLRCNGFQISRISSKPYIECYDECFQNDYSVWTLDATNCACTVCQHYVDVGGGLPPATRDVRRDHLISTQGECLTFAYTRCPFY